MTKRLNGGTMREIRGQRRMAEAKQGNHPERKGPLFLLYRTITVRRACTGTITVSSQREPFRWLPWGDERPDLTQQQDAPSLVAIRPAPRRCQQLEEGAGHSRDAWTSAFPPSWVRPARSVKVPAIPPAEDIP